MTAQVGRISAGFNYCFMAVKNADGYVIGSSAAAPAAGDQDGSGFLRLEGAVTADVALPDSELQDAIGDDVPLVRFDFGPPSLPGGVMELQARNYEFEALCQGTLVRSPYSTLKVTTLQPRDAALPTLVYILQRRAVTWEPSNRGVQAWEILYVPAATTRPLFKVFQTRQTGPYRYSIAASHSDKLPWGATFTLGVDGTTSAPLVPIVSENPVYQDNYIGDNTETVFNLTYTPVAVGRFVVAINGVEQVYTTNYTVSIVNKTITFISPPGSNAVINVLYEVAAADLE
jgi:hypothetical protein